MTLKSIATDFVDRVGTDGLEDVKRSKTLCGKSIWLILLIFAWAMVCYQIRSYMIRYFGYPVTTKLTMMFDSDATFPAVTFCNLNPAKFQLAEPLLGGGDLADILMQKPPVSQVGDAAWASFDGIFDPFSAIVNVTDDGIIYVKHDADDTPHKFDFEEYVNYEDIGDMLEDDWTPDKTPDELLKQDAFFARYLNLTAHEKRWLGHDLSVMLIDCVWRQQQCFPDNFTRFHHPSYGNCYTFNAGWTSKFKETPLVYEKEPISTETGYENGYEEEELTEKRKFNGTPSVYKNETVLTEEGYEKKEPAEQRFVYKVPKNNGAARSKATKTILKTSMPGPLDGLSIQLFAEAEEYLPLLASSTGFRVLIHDQNTPPHLEDTGFTISTGFSTSLEVSKINIKRKGLPYGGTDCSEDFKNYKSSVQKFWPRANYTMVTCTKLCYQELLLKYCQCVDPQLYVFEDHLQTTVRGCTKNSSADGKCWMKFERMFRQTAKSGANSNSQTKLPGTFCQVKCPQACSEVAFDARISSAQWPNPYYMPILKHSIVKRQPLLEDYVNTALDTDIEKNVVELKVYYHSLNYKLIEEEAGYEFVDLLADIGGGMDLWVGMSVMAMFQFVEFFIEIVFYLLGCSNDRQSRRTTPVSNFVSPNDEMKQTASNLEIYQKSSLGSQTPPNVMH